jgi:hypothetical protein
MSGGSVLKRAAKLFMSDTSEASLMMLQSPGGFQGQVNVQPAPAVAGDFASSNPRSTFDAGAGGLVAGGSGVAVGLFAWVNPPHDPDGTALIATNNGSGNVAGFIHREQQALITTYLADATQVIPQGFGVTIMTQGDFWVKNNGTGPALFGQKAFANYTNGQASFFATGSGPTASISSGSLGSQSLSFNGSISGDVLTVTAMGTGSIATGLVVGAVVSGGTGVVAGTQITQQLSGVTGSVGTYLVNNPEQTVASALLTATYATLTVTTVTGTIGVGDIITTTGGSAIVAGTVITQLGTGTGGTGTYYVNQIQTVSATTMVAALAAETKWYAVSNALPGELVKISSWVGTYG